MTAVALLVDVDNIYMGLQSSRMPSTSAEAIAVALKAFAGNAGTLVAARAYGTRAKGKSDPMKSFASANFEVFVEETSRGMRGTNMDIRMSMDGQEILFTRPDIAVYVIASGDSDFRSLADAVRQRGHTLIIIAPKLVTSRLLIDKANLFVPLEDFLSEGDAKRLLKGIALGRKDERRPGPPKQISNEAGLILKLFMCHSRHDQTKVQELYRRLKGEYGIRPWLDKEDLLGGQDWELEITRAVRNADAVVVCLSKRAMDGAGFVHKEIKLALDAADRQPEDRVFIIPVRLENCAIPERLSRYHAVDFFEQGGYAALMRTIQARAAAIQ